MDNAEDRALEIELRVNAEIDAGLFKLAHGWGYLSRNDRKPFCFGCALGAVAFACGGSTETGGKVTTLNSVYDSELITKEECLQLEMGYENWTYNTLYSLDGNAIEFDRLEPNPEDPFYKLGVRLRDKSVDNPFWEL